MQSALGSGRKVVHGLKYQKTVMKSTESLSVFYYHSRLVPPNNACDKIFLSARIKHSPVSLPHTSSFIFHNPAFKNILLRRQ